MPDEDGETRWIGSPMPVTSVAAGLLTGATAVLIAGVQPVMFGELLSSHRISVAQIGPIAALELFTLGIGVIIAGALPENLKVRHLAIIGALLLALANLAATLFDGNALLIVRGLAGLPAGMLLWIGTSIVVRSPRPTLLQATSYLIQAATQCAVAAGIALIAPEARNAVPQTLAILALCILFFSRQLPVRFTPLPKEPTVSGLPPLRGWLVLAATLFLQACIVGAWVYAEPLAKQAGLTPTQISFATPISLGSQLIGGGAAIMLTRRGVPWFAAMNVAGIALCAVLVALAALPSLNGFLLLEACFGALWTFILAYVTPFAIENDPTRRTAMLCPAALLIGSALGPLAASMLASEDDAARVLRFCAALSMLALAIIAALFVTHGRGRRPAAADDADLSSLTQ